MLAAFAEFERGRIVERITTGKYLKKKKGGHVGGEAPYGYRIVGRGPNAVLEADPEEQKVVEMIRERIKNAHDVFFSPSKTVKEFKELDIKTRTGKHFQNCQIRRIAEAVRAQTC
jgi:DNA invertase Pin-like site-specific DNA recombinase